MHYIIRGALDRAVRWRHLGINKAAVAEAPAPCRTAQTKAGLKPKGTKAHQRRKIALDEQQSYHARQVAREDPISGGPSLH